MYKLLKIFVGLVIFSSSVYAQDTLWTRTYGGTKYDISESVQECASGGFIIVGETESYGDTFGDIYLIRTDANGDTLWTRTYGGTDEDYGYSVKECSSGGFIITGYTYSYGAGSEDVYLIRTDANGDTLWTKTYGGTSWDEGYSVQECSSGGFIITGRTDSYGAGSDDVYLIRTDANGDTLWTKTYGGTSSDEGWSVQECKTGGFIIAGYTDSYGAGSDDVYLIRTDANGTPLWTRTYGGTSSDEGESVQEYSSGGFIITGETDSYGIGLGDVYLIRTDSLGDTLWTKTYGGAGADRGFSVQECSDGGFIIAGGTYSYGAGNADVYLIRTDSLGDTLWTRIYGGSNDDVGYSVQECSSGGFIIAGGTNSFGAGDVDVYLIRIVPSPQIQINPDSLYTPLTSGEAGKKFLVIENTGDTTLNWSISEVSSVNWLSENPVSGSVNPGDSISDTITFDATGLSAGDYYDTLIISSNDISDPTIKVPVKLTVYPPPLLIDVSPKWAMEGDTMFTLTAICRNADSAYIGFRKGGYSGFTYREMFFFSDTSFTYTIPEGITISGIEYYLELKNRDGGIRRYPPPDSIPNFYSIPVTIGGEGECRRDRDGNPMPQPSGTSQNAYRIIAFPIIPGDSNAMGIFSKSLGEYDTKKWKVGQYQGDEDIYIDDPKIHPVAPGEAYFVIVRDTNQVIYSGSGRTVKTNEVFTIHLHPGWNMVGNPFPFFLPLNAMSLGGGVPNLWSYRGSWTQATELAPWEGYVIGVPDTIDLYIDPTQRGMKNREVDKGVWSVQISAYCEDAMDTYNFVGYKKDAKDGWDNNDIKEPPPLGEYISLYYPHKDWGDKSGKYATDWRNSENQKYDFEVETPIRDEVRLKFSLNNISETKEVYLIDKENGDIINIRETNEYRYNNNDNIHHFSLIIGTKGYVRKQANNALKVMRVIAPTFITSSLWEIEYRVVWDSDILLEIYDNIGRKVETLFNGKREKGTYRVVVDKTMHSGIYFIRMKYGNDAVVQKIVVIK